MEIAHNKVVTIDYTLTDLAGNLIDSSQNSGFAYLHGAGNIIPGLEDALTGKTAGEELDVQVAPEHAYGMRDESKTQVIPRDTFPTEEPVAQGMQFHAELPNGGMAVVTVTEVGDDEITIDGNHPLAGIDLSFSVKVLDIRDATDEELQHGHVHRPGDHHHD